LVEWNHVNRMRFAFARSMPNDPLVGGIVLAKITLEDEYAAG
jgi:hypothetical protein